MKSSLAWVLLMAAGLAAAAFVWVFGTDVLDVHKTGWMIRGDSAQHYLGWAFFRAAPWQWPLGTVSNFAFPFSTTIAFTDSIPLVALPLKLLSPWLPHDFNFFGWWMAACLVGNSVAAAWVLHRTGLSRGAVVAGAAMFALAPCTMLRAYGHESLMAQGLLVVALGLALRPCAEQTFSARAWLALLGVCVLVHPYFWVMVFALFAASLLQYKLCMARVSWQWAGGWLLTGLLLSGLLLFGLGYFDVGGKTLAAIGYPNYSSNALTWFDPMDWHWFLQQYQRETAGTAQWSRWLPSLGQAHRDQYEGFAYLGAGALLLLGVAIGTRLSRLQYAQANESQAGHVALHLWSWPVWGVLVLMAVYALSTRVTLGPWVLLDLPRSDAVHKLLSVFRASGRFVWPLTYALMLWSLAQLLRFRPRAQWGWALLALLVQVVDLSGKMGEFHRMYSPARTYATPLTDHRWAEIMQSATHLLVLNDVSQTDEGAALSYLAANHGVVNSIGVVSRVDEQQQEAWRQSQRQLLWAGQPVSGHVYVSREELPQVTGWSRLRLNGWWVLTR